MCSKFRTNLIFYKYNDDTFITSDISITYF